MKDKNLLEYFEKSENALHQNLVDHAEKLNLHLAQYKSADEITRSEILEMQQTNIALLREVQQQRKTILLMRAEIKLFEKERE